jgi:hypothetical protein
VAIFENSSHIREANWNDGVLTVRFASGPIYEFYDVPPGLLPEWESAPSAGKFFNTEVKNRYQGAKV